MRYIIILINTNTNDTNDLKVCGAYLVARDFLASLETVAEYQSAGVVSGRICDNCRGLCQVAHQLWLLWNANIKKVQKI